MISTKQINQLISLLHEDYRDCKIKFIDSRKSFVLVKFKEVYTFKHFNLQHFLHVLKKRITGSYYINQSEAQIYTFNFETNGKDYYSVFVLFHELRHHYQKKFSRLNRNDIEQDCHSFAWRMLQKHHESINNILANKH